MPGQPPEVASALGISGCVLLSRNILRDQRGSVMHGLRASEGAYPIGEVYFSTVMPNVVKAWHLHHRMELRYLCVYGRVMVGLFDDRNGSPTRGVMLKVHLAPAEGEYGLLRIPPGVWNGYRSAGESMSIICNIASAEHDSGEIERLHPNRATWPFDWGHYDMAG